MRKQVENIVKIKPNKVKIALDKGIFVWYTSYVGFERISFN